MRVGKGALPWGGGALLLAVLHQVPQQFPPLGEQGGVPRVPHRFQGIQIGFLPRRRKRAGEHGAPRQLQG